jgi:hypothetical protein
MSSPRRQRSPNLNTYINSSRKNLDRLANTMNCDIYPVNELDDIDYTEWLLYDCEEEKQPRKHKELRTYVDLPIESLRRIADSRNCIDHIMIQDKYDLIDFLMKQCPYEIPSEIWIAKSTKPRYYIKVSAPYHSKNKEWLQIQGVPVKVTPLANDLYFGNSLTSSPDRLFIIPKSELQVDFTQAQIYDEVISAPYHRVRSTRYVFRNS